MKVTTLMYSPENMQNYVINKLYLQLLILKIHNSLLTLFTSSLGNN